MEKLSDYKKFNKIREIISHNNHNFFLTESKELYACG